jgi:hypothetical protein
MPRCQADLGNQANVILKQRFAAKLARIIHRLGRVGGASRIPGGPRSLWPTGLHRRTVNDCGGGLRRPTKMLRDLGPPYRNNPG